MFVSMVSHSSKSKRDKMSDGPPLVLSKALEIYKMVISYTDHLP
jgi:hypothetical protein